VPLHRVLTEWAGLPQDALLEELRHFAKEAKEKLTEEAVLELSTLLVPDQVEDAQQEDAALIAEMNKAEGQLREVKAEMLLEETMLDSDQHSLAQLLVGSQPTEDLVRVWQQLSERYQRTTLLQCFFQETLRSMEHRGHGSGQASEKKPQKPAEEPLCNMLTQLLLQDLAHPDDVKKALRSLHGESTCSESTSRLVLAIIVQLFPWQIGLKKQGWRFEDWEAFCKDVVEGQNGAYNILSKVKSRLQVRGTTNKIIGEFKKDPLFTDTRQQKWDAFVQTLNKQAVNL